MSKDNRDLLEVLRNELGFLESGGYRGPLAKRWRPSLLFEDSPSCPNFERHKPSIPCDECVLFSLVPPQMRSTKIPCRHIILTEFGESINYFYQSCTQQELETAFAEWLRKTILRLEEEQVGVGDNPSASAVISAL